MPTITITITSCSIDRFLLWWHIMQAGRSGGVALWREYRLEADSIVCEIREEFVPDLFDLRPEYAE